jgi:hypothetical protein
LFLFKFLLRPPYILSPELHNNEINIQILAEQLNSICLTTNSSLNNEVQEMNMLLNRHPKQYLYGHDAQIEVVWQGVIQAMKMYSKNTISLFRKMPGMGLIDDTQNSVELINFSLNVYFPVGFDNQGFILKRIK